MTLAAFGIAFIHGLISSLSACVYPLIPITTAIFGAGKTGHWIEGLLLSGIYVLGMAVTYVGLGILAALSGTVFGSYMGSPAAIIVFASLFFILGLSFLDIISIPLPNFANSLQAQKTGKLVYPLVLGIFSGFIAAPCTAPLYGAILIDIAKNASLNKSLLPGISQAAFFSFGMGLPFLLIGGFALKLPKPGKWLKVVKYVGAIVLFTAGFHYIEDLIGPYPPESSKMTMAILGVILSIVFLVLSEPLVEKEKTTFREKSSTVFFLLIAAFGLFLTTSLVKPGGRSNPPHEHLSASSINWQKDLNVALKSSGPNNLLLIDFRADWCTACNKMEEDLFPTKDFTNLVEKNNLILVRLDFTEIDTQEKQNIIENYQVPGFPTIIIANSKGEVQGKILGYRSRSDFIEKFHKIIKEIPNSSVKGEI